MADQLERYDDQQEMLRIAIDGMTRNLMTCLPVDILGVNPDNTVTAQPLLPLQVQNADGSWTLTPSNPMIHAPLLLYGGGGFTVTAPVAAGDEALAFFAQRSIDEWWLAGGLQKRFDLRSHHISDGFVFVGPRSQPRALQNINPLALELRTEDGETTISVAEGAITLKAAASMVEGPLAVSESLTVSGIITGASLALDQVASPGNSPSTASIPVKLNGVTWYIRLSAAP